MSAQESIVQEEAPQSIADRKVERAAKKIREVVADAAAEAPPPASPERITPDELAELRGLQQAVIDGQQREAQIHEAVVKAAGAFEYVAARLRRRYGLGERDEIGADGAITRG